MSSRALRRLQKQQAEQKALQKAEVENESEDEIQKPAQTSASAFALLGQTEEDERNEEDDEDEADAEKSLSQPQPIAPKSSRKKKKKKKTKAATSYLPPGSLDDDIDAALAALSVSKPNASTADIENSSSEPDEKVKLFAQLDSVDTHNLHVINEMRRLFGRDAIEGDRPQRAQQAPRRGRDRRLQGEPTRGFPEVSLRRNIFVQGKSEWPRATTGGLGMEIESSAQDGYIHYRFVHSTAYQDTQRQYEIAVQSMNPDQLVVLVQQNPYHIATLLQVAEIMKHDRMHTEAGDALERALFAFGRTVHSTFANTIAAGKARMTFKRPENREFFLACWRYIQNLSQRSTWRTVLEWAKLLYSLDVDDPYAIGLVIDQYALRANQAEYYIELVESGRLETHRVNEWEVLYSQALAYLQTKQSQKARATLREAIETDRNTAHQLCRLLEIEPLPASLWGHHEPVDPRSALFSAMYCARAKDLWNTPEAKSLLKSIATELPSAPPKAAESNQRVTIRTARHVYLTENDEFRRLLAACELERDATVGDRPTQDPFPPDNQIVSYNSRPSQSRGRGEMQDPIASLLAAFRGGMNDGMDDDRVRALMEDVARLRAGGPGADDEDIEDGDIEVDYDGQDFDYEHGHEDYDSDDRDYD